jgi:hypothetical protein
MFEKALALSDLPPSIYNILMTEENANTDLPS